ncbi:putative membrane transport protein [plant metagenome]
MSATPAAQPAALAVPDRNRIILLLALAGFASACAARVSDPLLPQLARDFSTTTGQAAQAVTLFAVAYGIFQFFFGPMGDRYGKYRTITVATLLCAIGNIAVLLSPTLNMMLGARLITGAAAAGIIPLSMAWIGDNVEYEARQATLARFITGNIIGMAGGQFIGGLFADTLGWRWAFGFLAVLNLVVGALMWTRKVPAPAATSGRTEFLRPMRDVFSQGWARVVLLTVFLEGALVFGVLAMVPAYVQTRFALTPTAAGAIGGIFALGGLAYVAVARRLVQSLGEAGLVSAGGLVLALACVTYAVGPVWAWSLLAGVLCGFGYYLLHATLQTQATQMVPARRGTAVSLFACCLFLGQSAGVSAAATVVDRIGPAWLFWPVAVAVPLLGLGFAWALRRRKQASGTAQA